MVCWFDRFVISIHAPVKGATSGYLGLLFLPINFNPRSREGSDTVINCILVPPL